jgi:alpha-soluble NSF attachment protein
MADADSLLAEAKKKATVKTFFGGNKLDDAAELYGRAANAFKLKKQCNELQGISLTSQ